MPQPLQPPETDHAYRHHATPPLQHMSVTTTNHPVTTYTPPETYQQLTPSVAGKEPHTAPHNTTTTHRHRTHHHHHRRNLTTSKRNIPSEYLPITTQNHEQITKSEPPQTRQRMLAHAHPKVP